MPPDMEVEELDDSEALTSLSIQSFLELVVQRGATDLHIASESPPLMRIDGQLTPLPFPPLSANEAKNLCYSLLTDSQRHRLQIYRKLRDYMDFQANL